MSKFHQNDFLIFRIFTSLTTPLGQNWQNRVQLIVPWCTIRKTRVQQLLEGSIGRKCPIKIFFEKNATFLRLSRPP